jgi:hypothetical protein
VAHGDKSPELLAMLKEADQFRDQPEELDRPTLRPHLSFFYNAFWILLSDRLVENGPIPFSAIDRFAGRYGVSDIESFERFRVLINRMMRWYGPKQASIVRQMHENAELEAKERSASAKPMPKLLSG